jgi:hypothetical protein
MAGMFLPCAKGLLKNLCEPLGNLSGTLRNLLLAFA